MNNKTCGECRFLGSAKETGVCEKRKICLYPAELSACSKFEPMPEQKLTNGDRIRQMSNEELAIEFATVTDCGNCDDCPVKDYCTTECCDPIPAWVAYFNAPAESEGKDERS